MSTTAQIIWKSIGIAITAGLLIAAVVSGVRMTPSDEPCTSLRYIIKDSDERMYLTEAELSRLLQSEELYPVGRHLDRGMLHRIERTIAAHPMVRTAECYSTPRNEVRVRITQRVPLLRVQTPGDTYLIDTDRRVMPVRASVTDTVLIARGAVGVQIASKQLADFAQWLEDEPYWQAQIDHIYVQNPHKIYLCLRGANRPRVLLGAMRGFERKLHKLRVFLDNGAEATKDKNYQELDIRFRGQVIGR